MNLSILAEEVAAIAVKAGQAIMEIYENTDDLEIQKKTDDSPLTKADQASNEVICDGLLKLSTQFPIVSEENKAIPYETRKDFDYYWLVDPLDGTKEFIKRNGEFTVNIALIHNQSPILGVVYLPVDEKLYWAVKGEGAFESVQGKTKPLNATPFNMNDAGLKIVCSRSHLNDETKTFVESLNQPELVSKGSSLKFIILAEGNAHVYPRLAPTMEWDTAAAQIVLEESGGMVINKESGSALEYNKENLRNPHFVAYGKVLS